MSSQLVLEGNVDVDAGEKELTQLRDEIERLQGELRTVRQQLIRAKADSESAVSAITELRNQLGPLYRAMRAVFGEIEIAIGQTPEHVAAPGAPRPAHDPMVNLDKWEGVKQRLGGKDAELIDILLTCGPKTNSQLAPMLKMHYSNAAKVTKRLSSLGFITKQGDSWALKS